MARSLSQAVSAYIAGDTAAFNEIYSLVYRTVFVAAKVLMKNEHDAEDVTQDVFIKAYKELANLKNPETANAWFRTVTRNTCLNKLRKRGEVLLGEDEGHIMDNQAQTHESLKPESAYITKERNAVLMKMVEELPLEQRETVLYYYIQDLSVTNIAALLECSAGTIKSRLNYARKKLRLLAQEREKQGIKLYGFTFPIILFLGLRLRMGASAMPLSVSTANTILETATGASGVVDGVGAAGGATGAVGGATGTAGATGATAATVVTSQAAVSSFIGFGGFMAIVGPKLATAVIALFVCMGAASVGVPMAFAEREPVVERPAVSTQVPIANTQSNEVGPSNNIYRNAQVIVEPDQVYINNMETWYQDGKIYVRARITNGYESAVTYDFDIEFLTIEGNNGEIIAQHNFGRLSGDPRIAASDYLEWTFAFPETSVNIKNADLRRIQTDFSVSYYYSEDDSVEVINEDRIEDNSIVESEPAVVSTDRYTNIFGMRYQNEVSLTLLEVWYQDGELCVVIDIFNDYDAVLEDINLEHLSILNKNGDIIAYHNFGYLFPHGSAMWPRVDFPYKLVFPREAVRIQNSDLAELGIDYSCNYSLYEYTGDEYRGNNEIRTNPKRGSDARTITQADIDEYWSR